MHKRSRRDIVVRRNDPRPVLFQTYQSGGENFHLSIYLSSSSRKIYRRSQTLSFLPFKQRHRIYRSSRSFYHHSFHIRGNRRLRLYNLIVIQDLTVFRKYLSSFRDRYFTNKNWLTTLEQSFCTFKVVITAFFVLYKLLFFLL